MLKLFSKTKRPFIYLLICTIIVSLASDMGKYAQKNQPPVDYSKFIEEFSEEESVEDVFLYENQRLLKYTVENKNMGYIKGDATQGVNVGETSSYVTAKPFLNYRFVEWSDGVTEAERHDMVWENTEIKAEFEYVGFPELHISVPDVVGEIDKEYVNATLSLSNTEESFSFDNRIAKIKVRGNSLQDLIKNPIRSNFHQRLIF